MKSQIAFPLSERLKKGKYNKPFVKGNFEELLDIIKRYHFALELAELELKENNLTSNSFEAYPVNKREPFSDYVCIGYGKFTFYGFIMSCEKYHNTLICAEKILTENNI